MSYEIKLTLNFVKEAKRLSKKYASLKSDLAALFNKLEENPLLGTSMGGDVYKIRLAIASKGKGKSAGGRVISYVQVDENTILLLSIYNKGDKASISDKEIKILIQKYT